MKIKTLMISLFGTAMGIILGYLTNLFISDYQLPVTAAAASVVASIMMEESNQ